MVQRRDITSVFDSMRQLRAIATNRFARAAALFGRRVPWLRDRPLPFSWHGRAFRARPRDVHGSVMSVLVLNEYEGVSEGLRGRLSNDDAPVIVDAGANVGSFALFLKSQFPRARVASVEASPSTYRVLADNVQRSGWSDWKAYNVALWDHDGRVEFADDSRDSANSAVGAARGGAANLQVPARRLDNLLEELFPATRISLLKLDIEGAEERVLQSVRGSLSMVDSLVVEVHADKVSEATVLDLLGEEFATVDRLPTSQPDERIYLATRATQ
jgi:FkbM family methyltransferase